MPRPALEVAQIFRHHGQAYRENHRLSPEQHKAMGDIERCRTAHLGGHVDVCSKGCGYFPLSDNSCRNRHCPKYSELTTGQVAGSAPGATPAHPLLSPGGYPAARTQSGGPVEPRTCLQSPL